MDSIVSNILANKILGYFNVHDFGMIGALSGFLISLSQNIRSIENESFLEYSSIVKEHIEYYNVHFYVLLSIAIAIVCVAVWHFRPLYKPSESLSKTIEIKTPATLQYIMNYMKYHESEYLLNAGHLTHYVTKHDSRQYIHGQVDKNVLFVDSHLNVSGSYIWRIVKDTGTTDDEDAKATKIEIVSPYIIMTLNNCSTLQYIDDVTQYVNDRLSNRLTHTRVLLGNSSSGFVNHITTMYDGPLLSLGARKTLFIDSYFSVHKSHLLSLFEKVQFHPEIFESFGQSAKCNFLFHGLPGGGKSSLIYRLARYLHRDIVSINLRDYYNHKSQMWQIIQNSNVGGGHTRPYILVLEELDIAVEMLHKLEQSESFDSNDLNVDVKGKGNITFAHDASTKLLVRDLLEIFDGTVPNRANMIIATSNRYEEMRKICPALFRSGRLTPVYFEYMTIENINEMSEYYFGQSCHLDHETPTNQPIDVPTSEITEYVKYIFSTTDDKQLGYEMFTEFLNQKLRD